MDNSQLVVLEQFKHLDRQTKKRLDLKGSGRFEQTGSRNDIVEYLNELFWYAKSEGVSDIHFQSDAYGVNVRFRLNSMKMADYMHLSREDGEAVEKRLRSQSNISDAEKRLAHSSRFHMVRNQELLNIRISFQPTMFGQNIVCRLLGEAEELPLADIAMNDALREQYIKALNSENGLILVSGPTGSGKTKTLMASIGYLNNNTKNLATVEDPVEIIAPGVNQTNVTPQLSFSEALRNILRQDPDIILVGETRDEETAKITVNAAFTGHLAFTSTHARNAP
ncbi:type II/IV secretion system family protein [Neisseria musculi]|uniref:Type II/IV secretion system family protein n=1 Tax=Neisseria musculi TaxID=1815583 RepID=A0A7H1MBZ6_9NEIS|nr:ATPase, T2SS/T4P/T4SS family [Neisseria musculi]QNT59161.1 type II/IV secretion system family protein [Neisseria musculi]